MKAIFKTVVERTATNQLFWLGYQNCERLSNYFGRLYRYAKLARQRRGAEVDARALELFPDLSVANGFFRTLRYPSAQSVDSTLSPKLLGSYESELHPVFEDILKNDYTSIVDIGCAEGYYAVGLALRFPHAEVYAFDIDPMAKRLCAGMAKVNGVSDRVHVADFCNEQALRSIPLGDRALIISDCEGFETALFTQQVAEFMRKHDVIIETHDFIDIECTAKMRLAFSQTHNIRSIKSIDDIHKAQTYQYPELDGHSTREKFQIVREGRPAIMEWLVMTSNLHS